MSTPDVEDAEKVMCAGKTPTFAPKLEAGKTYYWCTCGRSKNQPMCDGSHQATKFQPMAWTADKNGSAKWCRCKATKTPPFCDNSHFRLWSPCCGGPSVKVGELYEKFN
mmetsp:Transcript_21420/g.33517  ORF Transcript_21420/g.33517 Transcript_21420/m.33517 type:complete len:109 (-) Transcript_21420:398-724(-)|eukprot:CAMPEP_0184320222 /NCGR_PEP_ID=MMETSP1049-20130417/112902_1 /TAXON_ID=77928 /ORGANISM="Proteomonas sulcata, Strain CCMP704" /LENGTH=108 /DNA_ID=CAMNT_0026640653 /DNA_START=55 /DNA_END=381 /DNA_ORIENTATION=-